MIRRISGDPNVKPFKKTASLAFSRNDVVALDANGLLVLATATTAKTLLLGLMLREVVATDSDYASQTLVEVDLFKGSDDEDFEADVTTGTVVQATVGTFIDLDDEANLDQSASTLDHFRVARMLSASKVRGSFRIS